MHSQGSPLLEHGVLEQGDAVLSRDAEDQALVVDVAKLPEIKFANNEIALSSKLSSSEHENVLLQVDSVTKLTEPLAGTDTADVDVVQDLPSSSDLEENVAGPDSAVEESEESLEADTSDAPDVNHEVGEAPQIPELVLDDFTEVCPSLIILDIF